MDVHFVANLVVSAAAGVIGGASTADRLWGRAALAAVVIVANVIQAGAR